MTIRRVSGVLVIAVFLLSLASSVTAQSLAPGPWDETAKQKYSTAKSDYLRLAGFYED